MLIMLMSFMLPIVCGILIVVTIVLKIIKRMSMQIDHMEIKLLDIENRMR
ncbi:MAG: hypothetical protein KJ915_12860 [Candidatus Omnitrophica bacterium]|nr:hypothetical protein [Candidatus Omnitrophota bacterium]